MNALVRFDDRKLSPKSPEHSDKTSKLKFLASAMSEAVPKEQVSHEVS